MAVPQTAKDVDVIFIRFHCQQSQALFLATFGDESLGFRLYLSSQDLAVLWYSDEVIGD